MVTKSEEGQMSRYWKVTDTIGLAARRWNKEKGQSFSSSMKEGSLNNTEPWPNPLAVPTWWERREGNWQGFLG